MLHVVDDLEETADVAAAVDFLASRPEIDASRVGALGICASAGYVASVAADHPAVTRLALVAPWLHDAELAAAVYGGSEGVAALRSAAAEPCVLVAASTEDESAPMFGAPYYTEPDRGLIDAYDNRFERATWEPWLTYDALASADRLGAPTLVVGSEAMALPAGAHAYAARTNAPTRERWLEEVTQFDFYDRQDVVLQAADAAAAHLGGVAS